MVARKYLLGLFSLFCWLPNDRMMAQTIETKAGINLIPAPVSVQAGTGSFMLNKRTQLVANTDESRQMAKLFQEYVQLKFGIKLLIHVKATGHNFIQFSTSTVQNASAEAYQLQVTPDRVVIKGSGPGLFYGLQSLMQLLPLDSTPAIPAMTVKDFPRFAHRGLMLDVARYMMPVSFIKQLLDQMAFYKLNQFHWHLTDDQGWRLEVKKYPKLTQVGAYRDETIVGHPLDRKTPVFDGIRHGGFYTQSDVREIVRYAAERHITVIPEIEMPGHAVAAIAAYPELGCQNPPTRVSTTWGVHNDVYCPNEVTFRFLEDVLTEVIDLFPSLYIHIGGDECPTDRWKTSAYCQELIKREGLKDEHGLQSWFIHRIEKFLNSKGRKMIGWDEILEGGLAPNATVMSWRGEEGGIEAAKQGHDVIMTPMSHLYIDYYQSKEKGQEPKTIGGYVPLEKVYGYDPVPNKLSEKGKSFIKGVQVNMWTEYAATPDKINYMLYPRMLALAEVAWSPLAAKNLTDFTQNRLPIHLNWLEQAHIFFRVPVPLGVVSDTLKGDDLTIAMQPSVDGSRIYYTLDGSDPGEAATLYTKPVRVKLMPSQQLFLKTVTVTSGNRRSIVNKTLLLNPASADTN